MNTVGKKEELDEYQAYALLIGLGKTYAVEVQPHYTMADIKMFISAKSGMPLDAVDLATTSQNQEIENDIDVNVVADDETCEELSRRINERTITGPGIKAALCISYGIRMKDPVYDFRVPTVHAPGSFMPEQEEQPQRNEDGSIVI